MKKTSIIAVSALSLVLLSGCGNSDSENTQTSDITETVIATPTLTPEQEKLVAEYATEEKDPLAELLKPAETTAPTDVPESKTYLLEKDEFLAEWKAQEGVLIDLRTPAEIEVLPMLDESAKNFDVYTPDFTENFRDLDKETPYFIYCAHANRSAAVYKAMQQTGFTNVFELKGGIDQ